MIIKIFMFWYQLNPIFIMENMLSQEVDEVWNLWMRKIVRKTFKQK